MWAAARADQALDAGLGVTGARDFALALPADPLAAVTVMLDQLELPGETRISLLSRLLTDGAGWAAQGHGDCAKA